MFQGVCVCFTYTVTGCLSVKLTSRLLRLCNILSPVLIKTESLWVDMYMPMTQYEYPGLLLR